MCVMMVSSSFALLVYYWHLDVDVVNVPRKKRARIGLDCWNGLGWVGLGVGWLDGTEMKALPTTIETHTLQKTFGNTPPLFLCGV